MPHLNPYLTFKGNTEDAFNFYKSVFGGDFAVMQRFGETPDGGNVAENEKNMVMHVALPLGQSNVLMASDSPDSMNQQLTMGDNISLSISADSKEEAEKIFNGLSAGGKVTMPIADTFWGAYFGMCTDKFGIHWMVNYDYPKS